MEKHGNNYVEPWLIVSTLLDTSQRNGLRPSAGARASTCNQGLGLIDLAWSTCFARVPLVLNARKLVDVLHSDSRPEHQGNSDDA